MPTRDMVQAKGDKVSVARTAIEKINVHVDKSKYLEYLNRVLSYHEYI